MTTLTFPLASVAFPVITSFTAPVSAPVATPVEVPAPVATLSASLSKCTGGKVTVRVSDIGAAALARRVAVPLPEGTVNVKYIGDIAMGGRNDTIKAIKDALRKRSGKSWSVTGGRGTAYGWINIVAPPARCTAHCQLKAGATSTNPSDYEMVDTGVKGGSMTEADQAELGRLLGINAHHQGVSIAPQSDARRVYLCRALYGHAGPFTWEANWD